MAELQKGKTVLTTGIKATAANRRLCHLGEPGYTVWKDFLFHQSPVGHSHLQEGKLHLWQVYIDVLWQSTLQECSKSGLAISFSWAFILILQLQEIKHCTEHLQELSRTFLYFMKGACIIIPFLKA